MVLGPWGAARGARHKQLSPVALRREVLRRLWDPVGLATDAGLPSDLRRSTGARKDFQNGHSLDARPRGAPGLRASSAQPQARTEAVVCRTEKERLHQSRATPIPGAEKPPVLALGCHWSRPSPIAGTLTSPSQSTFLLLLDLLSLNIQISLRRNKNLLPLAVVQLSGPHRTEGPSSLLLMFSWVAPLHPKQPPCHLQPHLPRGPALPLPSHLPLPLPVPPVMG